MVVPIVKKSDELTSSEIAELNQLSRSVNAQNPENHIQVNHINKTQPTFYLFKYNGKILAFQAFNYFHLSSPFHQKKIPVIYINASYKEKGTDAYTKDYAKRSNLHFIKSQLGNLWFLKRFLVIYITDNPRLFARTSAAFLKSYPRLNECPSGAVHSFCQNFIMEHLKMNDVTINERLVVSSSYHSESCITAHWQEMYATSDINNQFFFDEAIILKKGKEFYLSGKGVLFLGDYSWKNAVKSIFL